MEHISEETKMATKIAAQKQDEMKTLSDNEERALDFLLFQREFSRILDRYLEKAKEIREGK